MVSVTREGTQPVGRFRAWRRGRPFWGGLFSVLGGLELLFIPLAPLPVTIHQGIAGVSGLLMGGLMVLMGLVTWFQPPLRTITGIATLLFALVSLITSNFGGFAFGMLLGLVGGSLTVAWAPNEPRSEPEPPLPVDEPADVPAAGAAPAAGPDAAARPEPDPRGPAGPSGPGVVAALTVPALLAGALLATGPNQARAAVTGQPGPILPTLIPLPTRPSSQPSPTPSPAPSGTPTQPGAPIPLPPCDLSGLPKSPGALRALLSDPTRAKAVAACLAPAPRGPQGEAARARRAPAGREPLVAVEPAILRATAMNQTAVRYLGVATMRTRNGPVRVLRFAMSRLSIEGMDQTFPAGRRQVHVRNPGRAATISGSLTLNTTRFTGRMLGLVPVEYTVERPPPPIPIPFMRFTDVTTSSVYLQGGLLELPTLDEPVR